MNKRLFSSAFFSSVLLAGTAFSMEEGGANVFEFAGDTYPKTPMSKARLDQHEQECPPTEVLKDNAKRDIGDLSKISANLANLLIEERVSDAKREIENKTKEFIRFLKDRRRARELESAQGQTEQELRSQLAQIKLHTETITGEISSKAEEILRLVASTQSIQRELDENLAEVTLLKGSEAEKAEQIAFYKKRVDNLKSSLVQSDQRLHELEDERSELVHTVGILTLEKNSTKTLLKAYSPVKKLVSQAARSSASSGFGHVVQQTQNGNPDRVDGGDTSSDEEEIDLDR